MQNKVEIQILILAGNNPSVSHTAAIVSATTSVGASALQRCPPDIRTLNTGRRWLVLFRNYAADLGFAAQDISRVLAEFSAVAQKIFKLGIAENDTPYMRFLGGIIGYYAIRKSA